MRWVFGAAVPRRSQGGSYHALEVRHGLVGRVMSADHSRGNVLFNRRRALAKGDLAWVADCDRRLAELDAELAKAAGSVVPLDPGERPCVDCGKPVHVIRVSSGLLTCPRCFIDGRDAANTTPHRPEGARP